MNIFQIATAMLNIDGDTFFENLSGNKLKSESKNIFKTKLKIYRKNFNKALS